MTREEALKIIKEFINGTCLHIVDQKAFETLIPELAESEDERIYNEIINYFKHLLVESNKEELNDFINKDFNKYIAWLEKQKDIWGEKAKNITANMLEDKIEGIQRELIEFLSNAVNASWVDIIQSADAYAKRIRNIIEKQKEQQPAEWSEEDEAILGLIQNAVDAYSYDCDSIKTYFSICNWLKNLRPQPKQICLSDKEIICLKRTLDCLRNEHGKYTGKDYTNEIAVIEWMITHPAMVFSHENHWKPSEEQMDALDEYIWAKEPDKDKAKYVISLYKDLEKLI